ncbi:ATP-binding cassette domain-containing protein [Mucisphaera calidilacus]|uniref:Macrolide export ATP-binding/permease protein MacB n=1 Tax=Mucisphaera calidilacus TaxID=2527982 RepID=A0A518BTQ9_9BACT|nr:ATP-binding cassette domain-containing protein [Mucisphaera calidilacus]QDU70347.1 Macrolide export ATP-binding/permease protein MacB [Mucisphaera calidilacus]
MIVTHPEPPAAETDTRSVERLVLRDVDLPAGRQHDTRLSGVNLSLGVGEMVIVQSEPERPRLPLADAIMGLTDTAGGSIAVDDSSWDDLTPARAARLRSQIGRVFDHDRWLSGLTLEENVFLAARYHHQMREETMVVEAVRLAESFGLAGLPTSLPSRSPVELRQKVAWIRALLGPRRLLILEQPLGGVSAQDARALGRSLGQFRAQGAAVIWITDVPVPIDWPGMLPDYLARVTGTELAVEPGMLPRGGDP